MDEPPQRQTWLSHESALSMYTLSLLEKFKASASESTKKNSGNRREDFIKATVTELNNLAKKTKDFSFKGTWTEEQKIQVSFALDVAILERQD